MDVENEGYVRSIGMNERQNQQSKRPSLTNNNTHAHMFTIYIRTMSIQLYVPITPIDFRNDDKAGSLPATLT